MAAKSKELRSKVEKRFAVNCPARTLLFYGDAMGAEPVRYWMATDYACGMLIVARKPMGKVVGGCPIYQRWKGQTLRAFFHWHAKRGGCEYKELRIADGR